MPGSTPKAEQVFEVEVEQTFGGSIKVKASNGEEALAKVQDMESTEVFKELNYIGQSERVVYLLDDR